MKEAGENFEREGNKILMDHLRPLIHERNGQNRVQSGLDLLLFLPGESRGFAHKIATLMCFFQSSGAREGPLSGSAILVYHE